MVPSESIPEVVVGVFVVWNGKILLVKSKKWGDICLPPGGHVELGETVFEAARREVKEETGLEVESLRCVNIGELIFDPNFERKTHLVYFHIAADSASDKITMDTNELKEYFWLLPDECLSLNVPDFMRITIQNIKEGKSIDVSSVRY